MDNIKVYIRCGNPICDKIDRVGPGQEKYESFYIESNLKDMGKDLYDIIKNGELENHQNTFTIEIKEIQAYNG